MKAAGSGVDKDDKGGMAEQRKLQSELSSARDKVREMAWDPRWGVFFSAAGTVIQG